LKTLVTKALALVILGAAAMQAAAATSYTLITEPSQGLTAIYNLVNSAQHTIDMTMYELTDATFEQYLANRAAAGVTVRVILDVNLEKSSNQAAYTYLNANGVQCHWAWTTYAATHQKTITIDSAYADAETAIMTLNLTPEYYSTSRDFALFENDANDIAAIETTFQADFNSTAITPPVGDDLVWSPTNSQTAMVDLINSAEHTLLVENEEMSDTAIVNALVSAAKRGVNVQISMESGSSYTSEWNKIIAAGGDVSTYVSSAPLYIHAKIIIADYGYSTGSFFLGSENFSSASLTENRELGLIIDNLPVMASLAGTLTGDFIGGVPYTGSPKNFTLAPSAPTLSVAAGSSGTSTITVAPFNSFKSSVALTVSGLPAGVTAAFSPSSIASGSGTSTLTFTASASAAAGTYLIAVIGTSGSLQNSTAVNLTITGGSGTPSFSLAASPATVSVTQGGTATSTISSTVSGGFDSAIALSAAGLPSGVTAAFSPTSITGAGSAAMTLTAGSSAATGTSTVTITGTGGGLTKTTTLSLTVGAASGGGQIITDGGFQSATKSGLSAPGWTGATNTSDHNLIIVDGTYGYAGDSNYGLLGGVNNTDDTLTQTITIPAGSTSTPLTFWVSIYTKESNENGEAYDYLYVEIHNTSGTLLATPLMLSNLNDTSDGNKEGTYFQPLAIDLSAYAGQTIELVFHGTNDREDPTTFLIDDISVTAN
jgi:cardiolipin synthase A/B